MLLYKLFNAEDDLLYVGITTDPKERFKAHARDKRWWDEVATKRVEEIAADSALEVERNAIVRLQPRYNVVHNHANPSKVCSRPITPTITVRLPTDLKRRLDAYAFVTGTSLTAAIIAGLEGVLYAARQDPAFAARMDAILSGLPPR